MSLQTIHFDPHNMLMKVPLIYLQCCYRTYIVLQSSYQSFLLVGFVASGVAVLDCSNEISYQLDDREAAK